MAKARLEDGVVQIPSFMAHSLEVYLLLSSDLTPHELLMLTVHLTFLWRHACPLCQSRELGLWTQRQGLRVELNNPPGHDLM